jgi:preprotein translocase subunit YajC
MNHFITVLENTTTTTTPDPLSSVLPIVILVAMAVLMYFTMIRPQKKQEKETAQMRDNLEVGDEITTIGGIIGKIISIKEETCLIETSGDKTKIRILKSAVKVVDVKAEDAE